MIRIKPHRCARCRVAQTNENSDTFYRRGKCEWQAYCRSCALEYARQRRDQVAHKPDTDCDICGQSLRAHPRCTMCGILIGAGHHEQRLYDGGRCADCTRRRMRNADQLSR